jgi:hypothetical protein
VSVLNYDLNWPHIAALFVMNFVIGWAWYSFLFLKPWLQALGKSAEDMHTPENMRRFPVVMGAAAVTAFLLSFGSLVLVRTVGASDAESGALLGLFVSLIFIAPHASGTLFEGRPYVVYGIGVLHAIAVVTLDCAIHAVWK